MKRLSEKNVFSGMIVAWRLAVWPTSRSPFLVKATTDGVVRLPSALGMTTGSPPSITATTELVVPRSIPTIFGIIFPLLLYKRLEIRDQRLNQRANLQSLPILRRLAAMPQVGDAP